MADQQAINGGDDAQATPVADGQGSAGAKALYLESLQLIERLHRRFLDVV